MNGLPVPASPASGASAASPVDCGPVPCPTHVTVTISVPAQVACPGLPFMITATGTPTGGTYSWKISGSGMELVDAFGKPTRSGPDVFLRGLRIDNTKGAVLEQTGQVSVTYTHPTGTAKDSQPVKIHKINFKVTDDVVDKGVLRAVVDNERVSLTPDRLPTVHIVPFVKIELDARCPQKDRCAANHFIGWFQTLWIADTEARYRHTRAIYMVPAPTRDALSGGLPDGFFPPFYGLVLQSGAMEMSCPWSMRTAL